MDPGASVTVAVASVVAPPPEKTTVGTDVKPVPPVMVRPVTVLVVVSNKAVAVAFVPPPPVIVTVGALVYPAPALNEAGVVLTGETTMAVAVAAVVGDPVPPIKETVG